VLVAKGKGNKDNPDNKSKWECKTE